MLKVLGRVTSINVRKVLWALDELGLVYEREDWGMPIRDPKVPEFLALNPNGQIPVIIDDDFVLWESNAILLHLAEQEGRLMPHGLKERALVLQWFIWQATELNAQWGYAVHALIRRAPGYDEPAKIAESIRNWGLRLQMLEDELARGEGRYVVGDDLTLADIVLALSIHRWLSLPAEKPRFPRVEQYYEGLKAREAGARWMTSETP